MMMVIKFRKKFWWRIILILPLLTVILLSALIVAGQSDIERFASPSAAFEWYKDCARRGDTGGYVECLTAESKELIGSSPPPADLLKQEYQFLTEKKYKVEFSEEWAIIIFLDDPQKEPPYLLLQEDNQWKIDLVGMSESLLFDENQNWYLQGKSKVIKPPAG